MEYKILEENMDRLEKKLNRIVAKCKKYGNEFVYEKAGEEYAEYKDENGSKYINCPLCQGHFELV